AGVERGDEARVGGGVLDLDLEAAEQRPQGVEPAQGRRLGLALHALREARLVEAHQRGGGGRGHRQHRDSGPECPDPRGGCLGHQYPRWGWRLCPYLSGTNEPGRLSPLTVTETPLAPSAVTARGRREIAEADSCHTAIS